MDSIKKNKEFILEYYNALAGVVKTRELISQYVSDEALIEHILFFDSVFPGYEVYADEIIGEGSKVVLRARFKGKHEGDFNGIPPTHRQVEFPFAIGYEIGQNGIEHHWLIADQMMLMEQLGVAPAGVV